MIDDEELVRRFPGCPVDHDSAAHYRGRLEKRLLVDRCTACGTWRWPPGPVCPQCWSSAYEPAAVRGTGSIHLLMFRSENSGTPDYPVITIELDEQPGLRFTSTIIAAPAEKIRIGARVKLDWLDRDGAPLPVFRLADTIA